MPRVGSRSATNSIKANHTVVYKTANVEQQQQQGNLISEKMSSSQQFKAGQAYGDSAVRIPFPCLARLFSLAYSIPFFRWCRPGRTNWSSPPRTRLRNCSKCTREKDEMVQTARDTAQRATQSAEENKEHTAGFIQAGRRADEEHGTKCYGDCEKHLGSWRKQSQTVRRW
ncbi:hypothetical protein HPP92_007040 [Vanilla planifolia]|uniref:Uncharacterized protein n=1 Tax=Vanilla planifolia TaxID=51239 RepID=A0A835V996_VANPL|nr:hypothetical protein HPP92_007040 [Vanilla planifolia]